jgi:glycosyltransferase involved in cell wall biosynthesis
MQPEVFANGRFLSRRITGVERYAAEILSRLAGRVRILRPGPAGRGIVGHAWEQLVLPARLSSRSTLWSPANTGPLGVRNQLLTLHDLSALEHPEWFNPTFGLWNRILLPTLVRRVRRIAVPSETVRQKVLRRFGLPAERVVTVPGGVDLARFHPVSSQDQRERYVLFVGTLEPRKNLPALLEAWQAIEARHPQVSLVVAGTAGGVFRPVTLPKRIPRLRLAGYASEAELPGLYAGAAVFVLPSLDEGFGLPVLEAMACGAPVIASAAGALPEVVGEAGMLFDPATPDSLAAALDLCLDNPDLCRRMQSLGFERACLFSWSRAAEQTGRLLEGDDAA